MNEIAMINLLNWANYTNQAFETLLQSGFYPSLSSVTVLMCCGSLAYFSDDTRYEWLNVTEPCVESALRGRRTRQREERALVAEVRGDCEPVK